MNQKYYGLLQIAAIGGLCWSVACHGVVQAQFLDSAPGFSPAFRDVYRSAGPYGEGYAVFQDSNGEFHTKFLGPSRMQSYIDFSGVPIQYGPMVARYMLPNPTAWQRNLVKNIRSEQERSRYESANPTPGLANRRSDRIPMNNKGNKKTLEVAQPGIALPVRIVESKPTPIPLTMDANGKLPTWLVSAIEFIDRFVKSGDISGALASCDRLTSTRTGLPSDIYTRAAVLAFLEGRDLDEVGTYVSLGSAEGARLSSRSLPGGSLEKYLTPAERRRFVETVTRLRGQAIAGALSDEHKAVVEALLDL
jgi:hypothetical protein